MDEDLKEELVKELPSIAISGSSIRTKPGTDPDELKDESENE